MYKCPVCGYDKFSALVGLGDICPSCGTEFGFSDDEVSYDHLRHHWLMEGGKWWSRRVSKPAGWLVGQQLSKISYTPTIAEKVALLTEGNLRIDNVDKSHIRVYKTNAYELAPVDSQKTFKPLSESSFPSDYSISIKFHSVDVSSSPVSYPRFLKHGKGDLAVMPGIVKKFIVYSG